MDIVDRMFELVDEKYREQREFAHDIGVDPSHVSRWRTRKSASFHKRLPQIAEVLGTTVDYLTTGRDPLIPMAYWGRDQRKIVGTDGNVGNLRQQVTENNLVPAGTSLPLVQEHAFDTSKGQALVKENLTRLSADEIDRMLREALGGLTPEELIQVRAFSQGLVAARAKDTSPKT